MSSFKPETLVLPSYINKFTWKWVVESNPSASISSSDFVRVCRASEGIRVLPESGRTYHLAENFSNLDEWVKEALWHHDPVLYESLKGYTKVPSLGRSLHGLLKYAGPTIYKKQVFDDRMEELYDSGLRHLHSRFRWCSTLPLEVAMTKIPLNTSAGYSFPGAKKGDVLDECYAKVQSMIATWKRGEKVEQIPCKLAMRGHLSPKDNVKSRSIWVAPMEHVVLENMLFRGFYSQIFSGLHHQDMFMTGHKTIERLNFYLDADQDQTFTNTDISGWDSLRCRFLLKDLFLKVLKPHMDLDEPWKELAFEYIMEAFIFTILCLPDGTLIKKLGGVPSGSFLTLLINSLGVWLVMTSSLKYNQQDYQNSRVLGDDFCFLSRRMEESAFQPFVSLLAHTVKSFFGLVVKPEKVVITNNREDRKFIGYQIKQGKLFREDFDLLCGMLYPESPVHDLRTSFTRVFAFMIIGGFGSEVVTSFYLRYLSGYYKELQSLGTDLFNTDAMRSGNLRVFKHVFKVDVDEFECFDIDTFRSLFHSKAKYFLSLGTRFFTGA